MLQFLLPAKSTFIKILTDGNNVVIFEDEIQNNSFLQKR